MKLFIHKILIVFLFLIFYSCTAGGVDNSSESPEETSGDFSNRTYKLYVPSNYNPGEKIPLVMAFHGAGSNGREFEAGSMFNTFAEVTTVACPMSVPLYNDCTPSDKISVLMIHGDEDGTLPFNGEQNGSFSLVSSPDAIKFWAAANGCNVNEKIESIPDNGDPSISVRKRYFESCPPGVETVLYQVVKGGHTWFRSSDIDASKVIINFLLSKSK